MTTDQYRREGTEAIRMAAAPMWKGPGETPHRYSPDYMAQGDCQVCGHHREAHQSAPDAVARLVGALRHIAAYEPSEKHNGNRNDLIAHAAVETAIAAIRAIDVDGVLVKVGGEIDRRDHLVNGPARLWMHEGSSAPWFVKPAGNSTEYVRADLVDELVRALEPFAEACKYCEPFDDDDFSPRWAEFFTIGDFRRAALAQKGGE